MSRQLGLQFDDSSKNKKKTNKLVNYLFFFSIVGLIITVIYNNNKSKKKDPKKTIDYDNNCTKEINPVYSESEKKFYINQCIAKKNGVKDAKPSIRACIEIYQPVYIVHNNKILKFSNSCKAGNYGFRVDDQLLFDFKWFDIKGYEPICYNNKTYVNMHHLYNEIDIDEQGEEGEIKYKKINQEITYKQCIIGCTKELNPVVVSLTINGESVPLPQTQHANSCLAESAGFRKFKTKTTQTPELIISYKEDKNIVYKKK
tara:strand:- start:232 stop:1005 length:774 start_codon:yes stop_codon:yes gene_type:complete